MYGERGGDSRATTEARRPRGGTRHAYHEYLEKYLKGDFASGAKKLKGKALEEAQIASAAGLKIKEIANGLGFATGEIQSEAFDLLPEIHPEAGGTTDARAFRAFGDLLIVDLKTGARFVDPKENWQLIAYALCALQNMDLFTRSSLNNVHLVIVQPEQEAPFTAHARTWSLPVADLAGYQATIKEAIELAESRPELRTPGEWCEGKYCDARTTCPAYKAWLNERSKGLLSGLGEGKVDPALADKTNPAHGAAIANLLKIAPAIEALIKSAKEDALVFLKADPLSVPGWSY